MTPEPVSPASEIVVRHLLREARLDLGLDVMGNEIPVGQEGADAVRCQLLWWAETCTGPTFEEVLPDVWRLGMITADIIDRAGMTHG